MNFKKHLLHISFIFLLAFTSHTYAKSYSAYSKHQVRKFVHDMVKKHHFKKEKLIKLFKQTQFTPFHVIRKRYRKTKTKDSAEKSMPWWKYRKLFIEPERIQGGVAFWKKNRKHLKQVESMYGVPASIIVATIGVETKYGKITGEHNTLDTLTTLAFNKHRRTNFFKRELIEFLLMTREQNLDPASIKGSYAGALGWAQFMPSSYRRYAVDFSNSGNIDLFDSMPDIIGSVANYYQTFGWQKGEPVVLKANVIGHQYKRILKKGFKPNVNLTRLKKFGIYPKYKIKNNGYTKARFFTLKGQYKTQYYLGLQNFYVITRYNHNNKYAMAVYELSQAIKAALEKSDKRNQHETPAKNSH